MNVNKNMLYGAGLLVGGLSSGATAGYFFAKRRLWNWAMETANDEIEKYKADLERSRLLKKEFSTPGDAAKVLISDDEPTMTAETVEKISRGTSYGKLPEEKAKPIVDKILEYQGSEADDVTDPELYDLVENSPMTHNVFDQPDRSSEKPYIISIAEFMEDEADGYTPEKITLTYYADDDALVDERDILVPNIDETVGDINMTMFGEETKRYSNDPNIVYVRNEKLRADFEVQLAEGSYAKHMGMDETDSRPKVRRMRDDG